MKSFIAAVVVLASVSALPARREAQIIHAYSTVVDGLNTAVEGSDYLTYKELNGYDIGACRDYCNSNSACESLNIFREYGTTGSSDPVYKCSIFSSAHSAADATNQGNQNQGNGQLTKIEWSQIQSKGEAYSVKSLNGAILAGESGGYLGFKNYGPAYDPAACANECDKNPECAFANLWQGWSQNGGNATPTCALFSSDANVAGTDTNTGNGYGEDRLYVTNSQLFTKSK